MFGEWLKKEKGFTPKAAHDVVSRLKRVQKLIDNEKVSDDALLLLEREKEFQQLSVCVKSQLRRTTKLYIEYSNQK